MVVTINGLRCLQPFHQSEEVPAIKTREMQKLLQITFTIDATNLNALLATAVVLASGLR